MPKQPNAPRPNVRNLQTRMQNYYKECEAKRKQIDAEELETIAQAETNLQKHMNTAIQNVIREYKVIQKEVIKGIRARFREARKDCS